MAGWQFKGDASGVLGSMFEWRKEATWDSAEDSKITCNE
jgi:hypothetical protein